MKKIITLLAIFFIAVANVKAQYVTIPDANFRTFLETKYPSAFNAAHEMDTANGLIVNADSLKCLAKSIANLTGVEYFDNLKYLDCSYNNLIQLPNKLPSGLLKLIAEDNQLTSLPPLPKNLFTLWVANNNISVISTLPNSLDDIGLGNNQLSAIPNIPAYASGFGCSGNTNLHCLPLLPDSLNSQQFSIYFDTTNIKCLPNLPYGCRINGIIKPYPVCNSTYNPNNCIVYANNLVDINDVSFAGYLAEKCPTCFAKGNGEFVYQLGHSGFTAMPQRLDTTTWITKVLTLDPVQRDIRSLNDIKYFTKVEYVEVNANPIKNIPTLPQSVKILSAQNCNFFGNTIDSIAPLPLNLAILDIGNSGVKTLPSLPQSLNEMFVGSNNIYCLPLLPSALTKLDFDTIKIKCLPNLPTNVALTNNLFNPVTTYPICNPTNNINQCQSFPYVYGKVFTDNNSNGIKDANEFYRPFVKELASNGDASFSNLKGEFAFSFDSIGNYSLKTIAPKYYKAVPDSNSFSFNTNNVYLSVPDIALQPTAVKDSLAIVVTPLNSRARPGFSFPYHLGYANAGTTNLYTTISFTYDTSRLVYDSSSVAIVTNTNNLIVISTDSLVAGEGRYAKLYFTVKPTAVIGDTLFAFANAVSSATTASSANATIIRGSFDPNDKLATPQLTPTQIANGDWIEYTIRFQNTGNDTAVNVVLADTLSSLLQPGYFSVIASSHSSNITYHINNNIVYFEFLNINLPDSATNYSASQGWITFKVKPLTGVTVGTYIDNRASIYFDYNKSVQTNIAKTLISNSTVPVKLMSYALKLIQTDKKVVENVWTTANEINASHFNIQRSIDGFNFKTVGQVAALGVSNYSFVDDKLPIIKDQTTIFYRLQMVDKDGRFEYSPIKQISLQASISNIRLYPNPAKDIVTVECANAKEILITDYLGRIVYRSKVNSQQSTVNTKQLKQGIYLVQVVLENGSIVNEKLIVE